MNINLPKTIALLELTNGFTNNDIVIKDTFEYYWKNYSSEFKKFEIIDTKGDLLLTLEYLTKYYNLGYRYFVGFSTSTILNGVIEWFNFHPDAIGISPTSTEPTLNIPKKIFRMTPDDDYILESVYPQLKDSSKIYYIYSEDESAALYVLKKLNEDIEISSKLISYGVKKDYSNLTVENIQELFINSDESQSTLLYVFNEQKYVNLYNEGLTFPGKQLNIQGIQPPIIEGEAAIQLNNKYILSSFKGTNTSIIWREGYNTLGQNNYSIVALNILNLLNNLITKKRVSNINSHFSILQFDPVTRDIIYPTFLIETFRDGKYNNTFLSVDDPSLGKYEADFVN